MFSFLFIISSTFWFPCTRDFLHGIGALTPRGLHTASLGFAAKVTKENTVSVSRAELHLFPWRKCWDGIQIRKSWKLLLLHEALLSEFSALPSIRSFMCVWKMEFIMHTNIHSFSIDIFVQIACCFHTSLKFQSKLLSTKVQCDLLLLYNHWKKAAGIFAF